MATKINADIHQRAAVSSRSLEWVPSPLPGVERRMIERDGDEVARATSIVRYAPGSSFTAHTHTGGEEFIVLDGVFSDETGDFPTGMYVRNPVGSHHTPASADGCTILVKLWQMHPDDREFVRIDLTDKRRAHPGRDGEWITPLHDSPFERVAVVKWQPGSDWPVQSYDNGVEFFVLDGSFFDEAGSYEAGAWLRLPPGTRHTPRSDAGCTFYRKTGHLTVDLPTPQ